jgi:cytochrome oxidase Cu insertion factor (SCO1/SenC/PrrC family)
MHNPPPQKLEWLVWTGLGLVMGLVLGAFAYARLGPARVAEPPLPVLSQVTGFSLTNQFEEVVTAEALRGRPWLGEIIFTRCPGPCVRMTRNLAELQNRLPRDADLRFVTLTADPAYDTPAVLRAYAERFGADSNRWHFLTGPQVRLYELATKQLLLAVAENPDPANAPPDELFIHSTRMVLVDAAGRVRAAYDGESPAAQDQVLEDLRRLAAEPR